VQKAAAGNQVKAQMLQMVGITPEALIP